MVAGLVLGIDLCDDYCQISCFNQTIMDAEAVSFAENDENCLIPTVICKGRKNSGWYIGEEAYGIALCGNGTMVDKLIKLVSRDGTATMEGIKYSAEELLHLYIGRILEIPMKKYGNDRIDQLVFTLQQKDAKVMDALIRISDSLGLLRGSVHMASHAEAYLYYVISQKKEVWINQTCLFDLTESGLHYYEMSVLRGRKPNVVEVAHEALEEGFSLDILDTPSGCKLADTILTSCAERLLNKKIISSVFLTGRGFEQPKWAENFLKLVCAKRRAFAGQNLFAKGAAFMAFDVCHQTSSYPYLCVCEGRLFSTVSMNVVHEGRPRQLIVAAAGQNWYEAKTAIELIPDQSSQVEFTVVSYDRSSRQVLTMELPRLPERPNKATRIELIVSFTSEHDMTVRIFDRGFGEFFPATQQMTRQDFAI